MDTGQTVFDIWSSLTYRLYVSNKPHVYCVVCYRVIATSYVLSVVVALHSVTLLMAIRYPGLDRPNGLYALLTPSHCFLTLPISSMGSTWLTAHYC